MMWRLQVYQRYSRRSQQQQPRRKNGQTGRSIDGCSSRRTQKTRNLELGGGFESGDGGDYVIRDWRAGGADLGEGWQNTLRSTARSSKLVKNRKKSNAGPSRSTSFFSLSKFVLIKFPNPGSTHREHHPELLFVCFNFFFPKLSLINIPACILYITECCCPCCWCSVLLYCCCCCSSCCCSSCAGWQKCCWFIESDYIQCFLSLHSNTNYFQCMYVCSTVTFRVSIGLYCILGNCGHAQSQSGRQPAAGKHPKYFVPGIILSYVYVF